MADDHSATSAEAEVTNANDIENIDDEVDANTIPDRQPSELPPSPLATSQPKDRNVNFVKSRSGQRFLMLDECRYFRDTENEMLIFWKCHALHKSGCPAAVATTKNESIVRVVVLNDTHVHRRKKRPMPAAAATATVEVAIASADAGQTGDAFEAVAQSETVSEVEPPGKMEAPDELVKSEPKAEDIASAVPPKTEQNE